VARQSRACQTAACSAPVPPGLLRHGVCLSHYLDDAFTRVARTLQLCQQGQPLDSGTLVWLTEQGDLAVRLLSQDALGQYSDQRSKLLELLLCLANVQEYIRHHSVSKSISQR
jgi:hypothetical protein